MIRIDNTMMLLGDVQAQEDVESICQGAVTSVLVLLFDKTPASNWALSWHQDRTIAAKQRADVEGFCPWTVARWAQ